MKVHQPLKVALLFFVSFLCQRRVDCLIVVVFCFSRLIGEGFVVVFMFP